MDRYFSFLRRAPSFDAVVAGVPMEQAAAIVGASRESGRNRWAQSAGMTLKVGRGGGGLTDLPATDRTRLGRGLTAVERGQIQAGVAAGMSQSDIARMVGRHRSVISPENRSQFRPGRDVLRVGGRALAAARSRRPKPFKLIANEPSCRRIEAWMDDGWSPRLDRLGTGPGVRRGQDSAGVARDDLPGAVVPPAQ